MVDSLQKYTLLVSMFFFLKCSSFHQDVEPLSPLLESGFGGMGLALGSGMQQGDNVLVLRLCLNRANVLSLILSELWFHHMNKPRLANFKRKDL